MKHLFESAKSDSPDTSLVRPSNWNAQHIHQVTSISGNTTLDATHDLVLCTSGAGGITVTLPTAVGITGRTYWIKKVDSGVGAATVDADGTELIDGSLTYALANQYQYVKLVSDGVGWVIIANN